MASSQHSDGRPDGQVFGQTTASDGSNDKLAFFGGTPTSRRSAAALSATLSLFASTGASLVANTSGTVSGVFGFTSAQFVALWDAVAEIRNTLAGHNLHKGGA